MSCWQHSPCVHTCSVCVASYLSVSGGGHTGQRILSLGCLPADGEEKHPQVHPVSLGLPKIRIESRVEAPVSLSVHGILIVLHSQQLEQSPKSSSQRKRHTGQLMAAFELLLQSLRINSTEYKTNAAKSSPSRLFQSSISIIFQSASPKNNSFKLTKISFLDRTCSCCIESTEWCLQ